MTPSGAGTAVTGAPGAVLPCDTLDQGPQPSAGLPHVVYTPPPGSARNNVMIPSVPSTAVTGAPGAVLPCGTLNQGPQPWTGSPDAVNTSPPRSAMNDV